MLYLSSPTQCAKLGFFYPGPRGSTLNNLMKISLVLIIIPLVRLNFRLASGPRPAAKVPDCLLFWSLMASG